MDQRDQAEDPTGGPIEDLTGHPIEAPTGQTLGDTSTQTSLRSQLDKGVLPQVLLGRKEFLWQVHKDQEGPS